MGKKIYISEGQEALLKGLSGRRTVIITEGQLDVIREYESSKVLYGEFEPRVRKYMKELSINPCKPRYDSFFGEHGIPEDVLQNRMLDLGIISKSDKITEPEDANGKKHGVHSRKFIFSSDDFDGKMGKLYGSFFGKDGSRLDETDCGGVGAVAGGFDVSGGATNAAGVGNMGSGQYDVPFGVVQRRKIAGGDDEDEKEGNDFMSPALDRTPGKVAINRKK